MLAVGTGAGRESDGRGNGRAHGPEGYGEGTLVVDDGGTDGVRCAGDGSGQGGGGGGGEGEEGGELHFEDWLGWLCLVERGVVGDEDEKLS